MPQSRRLRQAGNQVFDRFLQALKALSGHELHAGRALELREFLLEREQALAAGSAVLASLQQQHEEVVAQREP